MADTTTTDWRRTIRRRAFIAGVCLAAWSVAIEARLVYLQVVRHAEFMARADRQQNRTIDTFPKRGEIRDRNQRLLAYSVDVDSIYAVPSDITDAKAAVRALCDVLDHCGSASERCECVSIIGKARADEKSLYLPSAVSI